MTIDMPRLHSRIVSSSEKLEGLAQFLKTTHVSSILVISDHQVFPLHGEPFLQLLDELGQTIAPPMLIPAGEVSKSLATAESCWTHMHAVGIDRKSLVIGLGGGVVTDLAGFVASCYMRGIAAVNIPTTLMGMVDAAIGGKTAVNLPTGKNLVGTFYHPRLILIAPHYLNTLHEREFRSGLAEVIKYGVIR
ncbi:MAG: 3-dehydroquinate synthase, partial [Parachlamydia sp.]|nr:3-dehydroquinate synthase [Parachlamydia sp.]